MDKTIKDKIAVCKNCEYSATLFPYGDLYCERHQKTFESVSECDSNPYIGIKIDKDIKEEKTYPVSFTYVELKRVIEDLNNVSDSIYMKIFKAIDKANEPQIGDRCAFWDDDKNEYFVDELAKIIDNRFESKNYVELTKNCAKIKKDAEF